MQELNDFQKRKKAKGLCISFRCINKPIKHRNLCYKCKSRLYRKNNPIKAAYYSLKGHAKAKNKEFSLTFDEFKQFANKVKLFDGYGITKNSYHIDRIDEEEGYHIWNIQKLTNTENVKKYKEYDRETKKAKVYTVKEKETDKDNEVPF